jgi:hypothetical protein
VAATAKTAAAAAPAIAPAILGIGGGACGGGGNEPGGSVGLGGTVLGSRGAPPRLSGGLRLGGLRLGTGTAGPPSVQPGAARICRPQSPAVGARSPDGVPPFPLRLPSWRPSSSMPALPLHSPPPLLTFAAAAPTMDSGATSTMGRGGDWAAANTNAARSPCPSDSDALAQSVFGFR